MMLAVRFGLELAAVAAYGVYGWRGFDGWLRFVMVVALPVIAAVAWGTFAVTGDPSRNGVAAVAVPGAVRLVLELVILGGGAVVLWYSRFHVVAIGFAVILVAYHVLAYDRFAWLLRH